MKNAIWLKASVIMMKYTPRVRRQTMPVMNANSAACQNGDRQGDQRFAESMGRENADRVGAEPDRCRVPERHEAAVTDQQIERDRGDCKDHHAGDEREDIFFRTKRGGKRDHASAAKIRAGSNMR